MQIRLNLKIKKTLTVISSGDLIYQVVVVGAKRKPSQGEKSVLKNISPLRQLR